MTNQQTTRNAHPLEPSNTALDTLTPLTPITLLTAPLGVAEGVQPTNRPLPPTPVRPKPGRCHTWAHWLPTAVSLTIAGSLLTGCGTITGLDAGSTFSCNVPDGVPCQNLASTYVSSLAQSDDNTRTALGKDEASETANTKATTSENAPSRLSAAGSLAAYQANQAAQRRHRAPADALTRQMTEGEIDAWLTHPNATPTNKEASGEPTTSETSPLTRTGVTGVTGDGITMPRRVPERVLTLFVAPWTDREGDLHEGETVYLTVAKSHWAEGGRRAYYAGRDPVRSVESVAQVPEGRPTVEVGDATPTSSAKTATTATTTTTTPLATTEGPTGLTPDPHWVSSEGNTPKATARSTAAAATPNSTGQSERLDQSERLLHDANVLAQLPPTRPGTLEAMDEPTYPPVGVEVSDDPNDQGAVAPSVVHVPATPQTGTSTLVTTTDHTTAPASPTSPSSPANPMNATDTTKATAPTLTQATPSDEATESVVTDATDATEARNPPSTVALLAHKAKRNGEPNGEQKGTAKTN